MKIRHALVAVALALATAGCASFGDDRYSDTYQDGSYYSAGGDGYGDYYYAPEPRPNYGYYDSFFYGSSAFGYGGFGGYCSVRYLRCPDYGYGGFLDPFHRFGYMISYGDTGWYDPFWDPYGYPPPRRSHHPRNDGPDQSGSAPGQPSDSSRWLDRVSGALAAPGASGNISQDDRPARPRRQPRTPDLSQAPGRATGQPEPSPQRIVPSQGSRSRSDSDSSRREGSGRRKERSGSGEPS